MVPLVKDTNVLSIAHVASLLDTTQKAVRRLIAGGMLKADKVGSRYIISPEDFELYQNHCDEIQASCNLFGEIEPVLPPAKIKANPEDVNWVDIAPYWENPSQSQMTFVDLFCGAGGLSKGLEMAGLEGVCGLDFFQGSLYDLRA